MKSFISWKTCLAKKNGRKFTLIYDLIRRLKNRKSARKSRRKRKSEIDNLNDQIAAYKERNSDLRKENNELEKELMQLQANKRRRIKVQQEEERASAREVLSQKIE